MHECSAEFSDLGPKAAGGRAVGATSTARRQPSPPPKPLGQADQHYGRNMYSGVQWSVHVYFYSLKVNWLLAGAFNVADPTGSIKSLHSAASDTESEMRRRFKRGSENVDTRSSHHLFASRPKFGELSST